MRYEYRALIQRRKIGDFKVIIQRSRIGSHNWDDLSTEMFNRKETAEAYAKKQLVWVRGLEVAEEWIIQ